MSKKNTKGIEVGFQEFSFNDIDFIEGKGEDDMASSICFIQAVKRKDVFKIFAQISVVTSGGAAKVETEGIKASISKKEDFVTEYIFQVSDSQKLKINSKEVFKATPNSIRFGEEELILEGTTISVSPATKALRIEALERAQELLNTLRETPEDSKPSGIEQYIWKKRIPELLNKIKECDISEDTQRF
jgi:hypothetical protein